MSKNKRQQPRQQATKLPNLQKKNRLSLTDMQRLFDESAEGNMERRWAIADCMGLPLAHAIEESEQRIHEAEIRQEERTIQ